MRGVSFIAVCAILSIFYIPWIPNFLSLGPGVDESWLISLHHFFAVKKQFGTEVIFTYGPYGFLTLFYYHPATFAIVFSAYVFLFLTFIESAWFVLRNSISNFWLCLLFFTGIFSLSCPPPDNYFLVGCVIAFLAFQAKEGKFLIARNCFLAAALALISLIKFTYALIIFPMIGSIVAESLWKKRIPWVGIFFTLSYLSLWKFAGQNFSNLWIYLRNSWEVASGYSAAMESPPVPHLGFLEVSYLFAAFLLILASGLAQKKSFYPALKNSAFLGLICFLVFKGAFVLNDEYHSLVGLFFISAVTLLYFPSFYAANAGRIWKIFSCLALSAALIAAGLGLRFYKINPYWHFSETISLLPEQRKLIRSHGLKDIFNQVSNEIAARHPFPQGSGPADIYSYWQALLLMSKIDYAPRPVFQSYVAYTPRLAEINAASLRNPQAPLSIFFSIDPIYDRLPAHDDGMSWPEIATRYLPVSANGNMLFLRKRLSPGSYALRPISSIQAEWNQELTVPTTSSGKLWVKIQIKPNWRNRILNLFYKPVTARLILPSSEGEKGFNLIPSLAEAGFLLSPFISSTSSFAHTFYQPQIPIPENLRVSKIKLSTPPGFPAEKFFEKEITLYFFDLEM